MVIHGNTDTPLEVSFLNEPHFEVKSHEKHMNPSENNENKIKKNKRKRSESSRSVHPSLCAETIEQRKKPSQTDKSDLEELRSVYKKCKAVVQKLERKYGHLLYDDEVTINSTHDDNEDDEQCTCTLNKKIIFSDDGQELSKEPDHDIHICPKRLKPLHSDTKNIEIEYDTPDTLPEDIKNLSNILHNENLEVSYRNRVIDKIKSMKQDYVNDIKFSKPALIEQLKLNPDDVLDFKGTNFSIISGYM